MVLADLGAALARSRTRGTVDPTPLHRVMRMADAERVRAAAIEAYGGEACGYVMEATGGRVRRLIGGDGPIWAPLLDIDLVAREPVRLPRGVVGAGCGLAFVLGRAFPEPGERVSRGAVEAALVSCRLAIQVLGRRVPDPVRLDALTATADFALNVALHLGPRVEGWRGADLGGGDFTVRIDGQVVARGADESGADEGGADDPLDAVAWLAGELAARDRQLAAWEIVATGSRVGILQVLPGQTLALDAGALGHAALTFA